MQFGVADDDVVSDELERTRSAVDAVGGDGLLFRPYGAGGVIDDRSDELVRRGDAVLARVHLRVVERAARRLARPRRMGRGSVDRDRPASAWSVVVLHDVADAALDRLDEFLTAVAQSRRRCGRRSFPDECTPIRDGHRRHRRSPLCAPRTDHLRSPIHGVALRHHLGVDRRHDSDGDRRRARRHDQDVGGVRRARRTRWLPRTPRPASGTTARSGCTCTTATSTSRRSTPRSRSAACRSTSTTATSTTSCGTCSTTPMPRRWCSTRRSVTASPRSSIGCRS